MAAKGESQSHYTLREPYREIPHTHRWGRLYPIGGHGFRIVRAACPAPEPGDRSWLVKTHRVKGRPLDPKQKRILVTIATILGAAVAVIALKLAAKWVGGDL